MAMDTRPDGAAPEAGTSTLACSTSRRRVCACRYRVWPAAVGSTPCLLRIRSRCFSSFSRADTCWLSAGCATCRAAAALVMLPESTIFTKYVSFRVSIALLFQRDGTAFGGHTLALWRDRSYVFV